MKPQGKISLTQLADIPQVHWPDSADVTTETSSHLYFEERGQKFDFLFVPQEGAQSLYVLFSGDALRKKFSPPVFQRWSWAEYFPGHCLFVSDPSLYLRKDIGLAWYCGTASVDVMEIIASRIEAIRAQLGVAPDRVFSYGSSGGGYAAIRYLTFAPAAGAIAINPQTCVTDYEFGSVDRYLTHCFNGLSREEAIRKFPDRLSLLPHGQALKDRSILLVQNDLDHHHLEMHFKPFCDALGVNYDNDLTGGPVRKLIFSDERGHAAAEPPEIFQKILTLLP